jgi:DnaJ-class molecular chaperone
MNNRSPQATIVCPRCGGSGTLRLGDQSYRTCLDCLGQGKLPQAAAATTTARVRVQPALPIEAGDGCALKGVPSSASR